MAVDGGSGPKKPINTNNSNPASNGAGTAVLDAQDGEFGFGENAARDRIDRTKAFGGNSYADLATVAEARKDEDKDKEKKDAANFSLQLSALMTDLAGLYDDIGDLLFHQQQAQAQLEDIAQSMTGTQAADGTTAEQAVATLEQHQVMVLDMNYTAGTEATGTQQVSYQAALHGNSRDGYYIYDPHGQKVNISNEFVAEHRKPGSYLSVEEAAQVHPGGALSAQQAASNLQEIAAIDAGRVDQIIAGIEETQLDEQKIEAATQALHAKIAELEKQNGRKLTQEERDYLLRDADPKVRDRIINGPPPEPEALITAGSGITADSKINAELIKIFKDDIARDITKQGGSITEEDLRKLAATYDIHESALADLKAELEKNPDIKITQSPATGGRGSVRDTSAITSPAPQPDAGLTAITENKAVIAEKIVQGGNPISDYELKELAAKYGIPSSHLEELKAQLEADPHVAQFLSPKTTAEEVAFDGGAVAEISELATILPSAVQELAHEANTVKASLAAQSSLQQNPDNKPAAPSL